MRGGQTGNAMPWKNSVRGGSAEGIGAVMGDDDRRLAAAAEDQALEYGQTGTPTPWNNPASYFRGEIMPGPPVQQGNSLCRWYNLTIYIGGQPQTAHGTACRQPDGTWRAMGGG
jgi:surface antigen